jgi:hypothetical protein
MIYQKQTWVPKLWNARGPEYADRRFISIGSESAMKLYELYTKEPLKESQLHESYTTALIPSRLYATTVADVPYTNPSVLVQLEVERAATEMVGARALLFIPMAQ